MRRSSFLIVIPLLLSVLAFVIMNNWGSGRFDEGMAAYNAGDYVKAFEKLMPLAEAGDTRAQGFIGIIYDKGRGVTHDDGQAVAWYAKSAARKCGIAA
jgi:TPR repeat protein